MARNFNTHEIPKSQLVSSWLHEIPSDLESEGEETLVTPSVYEQTYPRRQKDEIQHTQRQPKRQPKLEPEPESEPELEPEPLTPVRAPIRVPKFTPKQPLYPTVKGPARSPTRAQPQPHQNQNPNQNHDQQNQPPPQPPLSPVKSTPAKPKPLPQTATATATPTPLPLRNQILTNFHTNCTLCHPPFLPSTPSPPPPTPNPSTCPRCALAQSYTTRPHHSLSFLTSHLLPISEVLSFDETVAYLNQAVIARLAGVLARGGRGDKTRGVGRTWPTLDDFDFVRGVAEVRRGVLGGGFFDCVGDGGGGEGGGVGGGLSLGLDRFGMVRDRVGGR